MVPKPHYLLFCDGQSPKVPADAAEIGGPSNSMRGRWRFILEDLEAGTRLEACDAELVQAPERTALLAVVRGLEALEQSSRVTLVTTSRYVSRGLQFGLLEWRESDYCWEHFGSVQPIRNADLWRRIDHAMQYHQITCRWIAGEVPGTSDDFMDLQIEPMKATMDAQTATPLEVADAPMSKPISMVAAPLSELKAKDVVNSAEAKGLASGWLNRTWVGILGAPLRSLRLPSLVTLWKSWDGHAWMAKLLHKFCWPVKFFRWKRLAM